MLQVQGMFVLRLLIQQTIKVVSSELFVRVKKAAQPILWASINPLRAWAQVQGFLPCTDQFSCPVSD